MKKKLFVLLLVFAMVFSLAACGSGGSQAKEKLVIADGEWYGTDLYQQDTWSTVQSLIADSLFSIDPDTGALLDGICTNLQTSEDGLTMTMTVPEGKYYATGEQVEPEDVVASIEWGKEVSPYADGYANIQSMSVEGRDVIFHLSSFRSDLLYYLGDCFMGVIDKDQLDTLSKDELMWGAVPYGIYYVDSYEPGSNVTLKPNEGYVTDVPLVENKGVAAVKEIYVKFNTDDFTLIEEMKSGTVDYWSGITMDAQAQLKDADNVTIAKKTYPVVDFMEINTDNSIFADLKLRQGFCLLMDREALCELTNGAAVPAYSMIFDNMMYFSQAAKDDFMNNYANDVARAKQLIAEAGWADTDGDGYLDKDGQMAEFTMYASTDPTRQIFVQGMQEQYKQYGFKMNIEAIDWNYVHEYLCANDYDTGIHSLEWAEPILILNCCFDDPNAANNNEAFYAAINDAATTVDDQERSDKLGAIQIELHKEWNMIPVYSDVYYVAHNSALKGVNILQNGFIYWNDLAL
ncbi:MAG: hypothetical protein EOM59_02045 [Clostridia bacterium]|nr:hypothetical protein [Clostridia bacterium]